MQEEALALCRTSDDTVFYVGHMLYALGVVVYRQHGDLDQAEAYFTEALQWFRESGDTYGAGIALANLGRVARDRGNYAEAAALYAEGLDAALGRWRPRADRGLPQRPGHRRRAGWAG